MDTARKRSRDLVLKTRQSKKSLREPVHLGEELETDRHMVATAFVLAYTHPVMIITRDKGMENLTGRVYEELVHERIPHSPSAHKFGIPQQTINVFNIIEHDRRELQEYRQSTREFLQ